MKIFVVIALAAAGLGTWGYSRLAGKPEPIVVRNDAVAVSEAQPDEVVPEGGADVSAPAEPVPSVEAAPSVAPEKVVTIPQPETAPADKLAIVDRQVASGFEAPSGARKIDTVILHSSYNSLGGDVHDVGKIIGIYKSYEVAAHYIIGRDGTIYRLVEEKNIAYHAGVAKTPDGRSDVNAFSIGIELVNTENGEYTEKQYAAVNALLADIRSRHAIKYVLGHDDIAPDRKTDPWNLDWKRIKK